VKYNAVHYGRMVTHGRTSTGDRIANLLSQLGCDVEKLSEI